LVGLIANRPLAEIEKIAPPPALKKRTPQRTQLQEELEIALEPIAKGLANVTAEKNETNHCAVPLCTNTWNISSAAPLGWKFCRVCFRLALCPTHADSWQDRFVSMHVECCDIVPTWAELDATFSRLTEQKKKLTAEFAAKLDHAETAEGRRLNKMTKAMLKKEAKVLGLITNTSTHNKAELKDMLLRLQSVADVSLDRLVLDCFGEAHPTRRVGVPGLWKQYQDGFNFVDLSNKEFYKLQWPYKNTSRESLFHWCLLDIIVLQAHRFFSYAKITPGPSLKLIPFIKLAVDQFFLQEDEKNG
jgi:hypothetical protein